MTGPAVLDLRQPFTRAQARLAGLPASRFGPPRFRVLFRGVYVDASVPITPELIAKAMLLAFPPDAFASHATAARLLRVPMPTIADEHISVRRPSDRRTRAGVRCHLCPAPDLRTIRGIPVPSAEQLFVELASLLGLVDLVVVGDHLVATGRTTVQRLREFCASTALPEQQWRGARRRTCAQEWTLRWRPGSGCCWCSPDCPSRR